MENDNKCLMCGKIIESYDDRIIDFSGNYRYLFHSLNCFNIYKKLKIFYGNSFNQEYLSNKLN